MKTGIKIILVFIALLLTQCTPSRRTADLSKVNDNFNKALSVLTRAKVLLPSDSVVVLREISHVEQKYSHFADSLKQHASDSVYAVFVLKHFISRAYDTRNLKKLLSWHDSLILLSAAYPQIIEHNPKRAGKIAMCVVNSLEGTSILSEKKLLKNVERAIDETFRVVYGGKATNEQKRKVVDRYAVQYAARGIISMAEPLYAHYSFLYRKSPRKVKPLKFSEDYTVYEKNGQPVFKLSKLDSSWQFMAFNTRQTNFDLVFLIASIRAGLADNLSVPFIVARNPNMLNDKAIRGIGHNISGEFAYINLNKKDSAYFSNAPSFVAVMPSGKVGFATDNAIDFLKWLRAPRAKQKAEAEKKRLAAMKALKAKRMLLASLPPDTSVKQEKVFPHTKVILKGYWPKEVQLKMNSFYFGNSMPYKGLHYGINEINVEEKGNLLSNQWVIYWPTSKNTTVTLLASKKHKVLARFSDSLNSFCLREVMKMYQYQNKQALYRKVADDYPFKHSSFAVYLHEQMQHTQTSIDSLLAHSVSNKVVAGVLGISEVFYRLENEKPPSSLKYDDFKRMMSMPYFDTILYYSPFYGPVIQRWLTYGSADMQTAIDLLFSSSQWIPENHKSVALQYIWKQMDERGREDMMLYIDTTYLAGCSGNSINVKRRLEGYKRMAPGQKAPDIYWQEHGHKMDLYQLKADSIYVVFWADWCGHCKKFIPGFYQRTKNKKDVAVVAVCVDSDSSSLHVGKQLFPRWHHVWASGKWNDPLVQEYNVFATPTLYLLNKDGVIEKKLSGN